MEGGCSAALQRDVVGHISVSRLLRTDNRHRYSWLNVRETRNRWQAEAVAKEAAATARASYLASLQNGDHVTLSSSLSSTSPKRNGNLTPAVSFVRDEPSEAVPPTNGETKIPTDVSETVIILEDTIADLSSDLIPAEKTRHVNGDASAAPKSVKKAVQLDPKRILAQCLLEAALSRPEPDPKKPIPVGRPVAPPPQPLQLPRISMKDMVKLKMLPIDFAVNLARSAMGEGTEDDELVEETRLEGENDGGIQFTSARGDGMAGGVADPILVDAQGIDVEQDDQLAIGTLQDVETEMGLELVLDGIDIDQLDGDLF